MTQAKFKFSCDALGGDQLTVVAFSGRECISELYRYEIELKAPLTAEIDLDDVLDSSAHFIIEQNGFEYPVNGILSSFEEFKTIKNYAHYKAVLVPRVWKLSNYKTNEIFYAPGIEGETNQGQTVAEIIRQVFDKGQMASSEYDLESLGGNLLKREYICQYNESDFDFISRLVENEGIFYYFEQQGLDTKMVFVNDLNYLSIPRPRLLFDVAAMASNQDDCVFAWSCRKQRLPERVVVRDYNPEEPSLDVSDTMQIDPLGQGTEYIYGKNVHSDVEATYLSQVRSEQHICRKTQYFGESSVTRLQAGFLFLLDQHPNTKYNSIEYLTIEVNHEGQSLDMSVGQDSQKASQPQYQNSFVAISAETQYRPPIKTKKPKITGTLHARIDGELDNEYAQLDSEGRYKVSLPFDFHNENHPEGLASARVRMMQPYAGENRGMQFPMVKGTDVLLSFIDGDPDRPIIAGAINTPSAPGPVNANNQTESVIQTGGNNKIRMEDKYGSERLMLESPASNSWIRVGAKNDPIVLNGQSPVYIPNDGNPYRDPKAYSHAQADENVTTNSDIVGVVTNSAGTVLGGVDTTTPGQYFITYTDNTDATTADTAIRQVFVYDPTQVDDLELPEGTSSDGIRIRSAGNVWFEAQSRYGQYHSGIPVKGPVSGGSGPSQIGDLIANFGFGYAPTNLINHADSTISQTVGQAVASAHVHVSSLDTFTTQEGNIYDFGGYWNYNLGNSYAEDHVDQKAKLNQDAKAFNDAEGVVSPIDTLQATIDKKQADYDDGGANSGGSAYNEIQGLKAVRDQMISAAGGASAINTHRTSMSENELVNHDLLDGPGPHWNSVIWPDAKTGNDTSLEGAHWSANESTSEVWVQKKWGHDYEYHQGDAISISEGSTLDVEHGGKHVEVSYRGDGSIKSWSIRGASGKPAEEKKWTSQGTLVYESETTVEDEFINDLEKKYDRNTGDLYSHTHSQGTGMGLAKFEFDYSNSVALAINTGSSVSSQTFLGGKIENSNYIGGLISIGTFVGGKIDINFALAGLLEIKNDGIKGSWPGFSTDFKLVNLNTKASDIKTALNAMETAATSNDAVLTKTMTNLLTLIA